MRAPYISPVQAKENPDWRKNIRCELVVSQEELNMLLSKITDDSVVGVDTETTGLDYSTLEIVGFSWCSDLGVAYYVPLTHLFGNNLEVQPAVSSLFAMMRRVKKCVFYNAEYDLKVLEKYGLDLNWVQFGFQPKVPGEINCFDVMPLVWNTDVNLTMPSLKDSIYRFCGIKAPTFAEVLQAGLGLTAVSPRKRKEFTFRNLAPEQVSEYAACDPYFTLLLLQTLWPFYQKHRWVVDLDQELTGAMLRLMDTPILIDHDLVQADYAEITQKMAELEQAVIVQAGRPFNLGSPAQRAQILEELGLDTGSRTEGSEKKPGIMQTGGKILKKIADKHPIVPLLIEYAKLSSLLSKAVSPFVESFNPDIGGVRFTYKLCGTVSARLSAGEDEGEA